MWRRYLVWFAHEHVDFRHAEMHSILSMYDIPIKFIEKPCITKPYWIVELPTEDYVKKIALRSVLIKNCVELWSHGKNQTQLHENLKQAINNSEERWIKSQESDRNSNHVSHVCPNKLIKACSGPEKSFKVEVETFCKHFSIKEKVEKIEALSYLPLEGRVKLKNPDITLFYFEFYGVDPNNVPEQPYDVFFGRWIADGQRDLIQRHSLKRRHFIGNTSMDAQLALLMANQAQIAPGNIMLDPFVGSGSLLVAAGHFGAHVWGSDIDYMMLHGRTRPTRVGQKERKKHESIRANMEQYGIEGRYLDVMVSDFSLPLWRENLKFDAIVTDPPYGVREPTEKIGIDKENYTLTEQHLVDHVPSKVEYGLAHIYRDLLEFAAKHLEVGRRLVCWYPLVRDEYTEAQLPKHPSLQLIANSEQVLSRWTSRRLLTFEKLEVQNPNSKPDPHSPIHNFREKYFAMGDTTRRERKEKKAADAAANVAGRVRAMKEPT